MGATVFRAARAARRIRICHADDYREVLARLAAGFRLQCCCSCNTVGFGYGVSVGHGGDAGEEAQDGSWNEIVITFI